ncbi:MAG: ABC transporter permease [Leptolyngbya foveolarum]|uniref:ABC transporter permease n=1 Tax=Leptolyngbya foveolarum TaxID=47253 RepID=A0A2W4U287_9CYAN|nr:MAG: ABC transporter permease [Leptolyngbya foveolarum]
MLKVSNSSNAQKVPNQRDPIQQVGQVFALASAFVCLAPILLLLAVATTSVWQQGWWSGGFTLKWLQGGWETLRPYLGFSLKLALQVVLIDIFVGFPVAWVLSRCEFKGRQILLSLTMLPIAIPGIAIALALILAYPTWKSSGWLLVGGHILYTLPFLIGALVPALSRPQLTELESVAATLGASRLRQILFVTLPQVRGALLAATIMVITLSMGEFNISFFLFTPLDKTLPVELYASYITGRLEVAAANTVWFLIFVIPASIGIESLGGASVGQA